MITETEPLDADQNCILQYLKNWPGVFISEMEIARRADGKPHFLNDPGWASNALLGLVSLGLVEFDSGKCRVKDLSSAACPGKKRFIAPHLRGILEKSGRQFHGLPV